MSGFTEEQREIVDKLLKYKKENNIKELECFKLLRKNLDTIAIIWEVGKRKSVTIYSRKDDVTAKDKFFAILDFFYFVEKLEREGYIACPNISQSDEENINSENKGNYHGIYDRDRYTIIDWLSNRIEIFRKEGDKGFSDFPMYKEITYVDIVNLFERYEHSLIYPLDTLNQLKERDYLPDADYRLKLELEDNRIKHREQLEDSKKKLQTQLGDSAKKHNLQMYLAWIAIAVPAIISIGTTTFNTYQAIDYRTEIDSLRTAIKQSKIEIPASIAVSHLDTLQVNEINNENNSIKGVGWELSKLNKTLQTTSEQNSKSNL